MITQLAKIPIHQYPTRSRYNQAANAIKYYMANAVMDADENMMEYQHLIKDPKYKQRSEERV